MYTHIHTYLSLSLYIYIYILFKIRNNKCLGQMPGLLHRWGSFPPSCQSPLFVCLLIVGWRYLSRATCLTRPRLFVVFFAVSRIIICCTIRHF